MSLQHSISDALSSKPPLSRCGFGRRRRLPVPAELPAGLGYDAVGLPVEHGKRIMECLPRVGCVFADEQRWWWIVPSGSHIDVAWPSFTRYAVGGFVTTPGRRREARLCRPHLIHRPEDGGSPYTPPIPLYFLTCHIAGVLPHWSPD